jgi:ribose transport system substrate-binding protein
MGDSMLRGRRLIGFILAGALTLALTSCAGGGKGHDVLEKYYLVVANTKLPYYQAIFKGFSKALDALKVKYEMVGPDKYDPQGQVQNFRDAVATKPSGILIAPADSELMAPEIDRAISLGIPVITIDSDSPKSKRLTFIGTNNYLAGQMAGERLAKKLSGAGQFVVFTILNQENTKERLRGMQSVVSTFKFLKSIDTVDIKGDATIAFDTAQRLIEKRKQDIDAFVCLEALSCKEVADVLDRAGVKGKLVVGFDTDEQTLNWIERGMIDATIGQKPFTMGYFGAMTLGNLVLDKPATFNVDFTNDPLSPVPQFVDTGTMLIDSSNLAEFRKSQSQGQKVEGEK